MQVEYVGRHERTLIGELYKVTGGVDEQDNLLSSVEFYSLLGESWQTLRSLRQPRTEHGTRNMEAPYSLLLAIGIFAVFIHSLTFLTSLFV